MLRNKEVLERDSVCERRTTLVKQRQLSKEDKCTFKAKRVSLCISVDTHKLKSEELNRLPFTIPRVRRRCLWFTLTLV